MKNKPLIVCFIFFKKDNDIMSKDEQIEQLTNQMKTIYDADRDYEICLADLPEEEQDEYIQLREKRQNLIVQCVD